MIYGSWTFRAEVTSLHQIDCCGFFCHEFIHSPFELISSFPNYNVLQHSLSITLFGKIPRFFFFFYFEPRFYNFHSRPSTGHVAWDHFILLFFMFPDFIDSAEEFPGWWMLTYLFLLEQNIHIFDHFWCPFCTSFTVLLLSFYIVKQQRVKEWEIIVYPRWGHIMDFYRGIITCCLSLNTKKTL